MANQEHLDILRQGVKVWNQWRKENPDIDPDVSEADISCLQLGHADFLRANLSGANLSGANLSGANLSGANFEGANLSKAGLRGANFTVTNLKGADLSHTNLWDAHFGNLNAGYVDLSGANLSNTQLGGVDLSYANLSGANLSGAELGGVNLGNANLDGTNFAGAIMAGTALGDRDLRVVKGLETVQHRYRSPLSINTIYLSEGQIPEIFLQGTGVPDSFIEYMRSLVVKPFDFYSCFISYSSKDQDFAERLHTDLQSKGVRCWFAPEDLKIGEKFWHRIDESIRLYDKFLVVLSEHSVTSVWVENEVMTALEKEQHQQRLVLFPIKLDEIVMQTALPWAANIRRTRHIGDFTRWKQHDNYQKAFNLLLRDLKAST